MLAFGVAHLTNPHATWQGALGIALEAGLLFAALYAFTRSLWVVIGAHYAVRRRCLASAQPQELPQAT